MQPALIDLRATVPARPWKSGAFAFAFGRAMIATVGGALCSALRETAARRVAIYARPCSTSPSRPHARRDPNS